MEKYQISRVLEVFDGSSFEGIIDLGMGVYLKKKIFLNGIKSPINNENEKEYWQQAKYKLTYYLRHATSGCVYIHVDEYHDDYVYGLVYTNELDYSLNYYMFLRGYVWDNGIELPVDNNEKKEIYVLNTPQSMRLK
jgi:hypothetical protein